jgi:hypothetical protein
VATVVEESAFEAFVADEGLRLRRGLVAAYGTERGSEALAEALAYAWEYWDRVSAMQHPVPFSTG